MNEELHNLLVGHNQEIVHKVTAKDRFLKMLNSSDSDTFESILMEYIRNYGDTINSDECISIIELLSSILYPKVAELNHIKRVAKERASYLEAYLGETMYNVDNALEKFKDIQRQNAQAILDACNGK